MNEPAGAPTPLEDFLDREQERALFFGVSAARLRKRAKWAAMVLLVSVLLPHQLVDRTPLFLWQLIPELTPSAALAALALPMLGVAVLVGQSIIKRAASLAALVLGGLLCAGVLRKFGEDRSAWDAMALPETLSSRPGAALLSLALVASAGNLAFRESTRKTWRYVYGGAVVCALVYYVLPGRSEAPLVSIVRALAHLPDLPDFRFQLGLLMLVGIMVWPLLVVGAGATLFSFKPRREEPWISLLAVWSLPAWLFMLAYRAVMVSQATAGLVSYLAMVLMVAAILALSSSAVTVLVESFFVSFGDIAPESRPLAMVQAEQPNPFGDKQHEPPVEAGLDPRRSVAISGGVTVLVAVVAFVLALPPAKGTDWKLVPPTDAGDQLFGQELPNWGRQRREWDFQTRQDVGASARVELKAKTRDVNKSAAAIDPGLSAAIKELTESADELDVAGRRFTKLVASINQASQKANLPYYVDPSILVQKLPTGELRRHFFTYSYRIDEVVGYEVDGQRFATLRVKPLGHRRDSHFRLGFSRDEDPFALVVTDEVDRHAKQLVQLAEQKICWMTPHVHDELLRDLPRCGQLLADLVDDNADKAQRAILDGTERHELQHQIDGPHLPLATGVLSFLEGYAPEHQDRVNREVSAFLAEMTADGFAPRLGLWQLFNYLTAGRGGTYFHTAIIVFEAFDRGRITYKRELDGRAFWDLYFELWEMGDDKLREEARAAHERMYGKALATPKLL